MTATSATVNGWKSKVGMVGAGIAGSTPNFPTTMKALRAEPGVKQAILRTIAVPELGPGEALVKVSVVRLTPGVFGYLHSGALANTPLTLGHRGGGTIHALCASKRNLESGMRVRINPNFRCGQCFSCVSGKENGCVKMSVMGFAAFGPQPNEQFLKFQDGLLAEYVRVPESAVEILEPFFSFDQAALLCDLANAHCLLRTANFPDESNIMIMAPTGSLSVSLLSLAHLCKVKQVVLVGRSKKRCEIISKHTLVPCRSFELDNNAQQSDVDGAVDNIKQIIPEGVDAIIDLLPTGDTVSGLVRALRPFGSVVFITPNFSNLNIRIVDVMKYGWRLNGSMLHCKQDAEQITSWMSQGKVDVKGFITHRYQLEDVEKAISLMLNRDEECHNIAIDIAEQ